MLNRIEIELINKWSNEYPLVFRWGWLDGAGLSLHQAIQQPEYGCPAVKLAKFRYELTEDGIIMALRDIYNFYYDRTGESYIKSYTHKAGAFYGIGTSNDL